jgi:ATP-dependent DNA helicase RecG
MTKTELLEIIRNGENSGVEFKRDEIEPRALAKELVALANFEGGSVLLGVEDDGAVFGVTRPDIEEWVMNACRTKIRPEINPYFERLRDVEPGKDVCVVRVGPGLNVHSVWHDQRNLYYVRVGTTSRDPSPEELGRLFQQRGGVRAEIRPVAGATLANLDRRRLRDYFSRVREQPPPLDEDEGAWRNLLVNTELLDDGPDGAPTVAGLLLFGVNINRFLPQSGIDAAAYAGEEPDYAARERVELRGPLTPLMNDNREVVENGLVEQALEFARRNLTVHAEVTTGQRTETWTYPLEAVREAIVNALVHRDYLLSATAIQFSIYSNRLEVISPGRLPNGVTPDRMRAGVRAYRNQILRDVMSDYRYLEHMGMGIPRKVVRLSLQQNGTEPELIEDGEQFTLRLRARLTP